MRADRLLSEILLLQSHRRMSGREIAARLEISERTVHRDMEALSAAGIPIFALRGARGGWQLDEHWRTEVPGLDEAELRALLMSQPRLLGDARLSGAAERALSKLMAALPQPMREKAASIRQRLHVDTAAWRGTTEDLSLLPVVQDAVARDRRLLLHYRKPGERGAIAPRRVDPLGLVAKGSTWYLVAKTQRGLRTFRVSRMERAKVLEQEAKRPAGFDLAVYWKSSTEQFREGWRPFETVLRLEPRAAAWIQTWHIASAQREVSSAEPNADDGWVTLRVRFDHEKEALFMVLGLGSRVQVLEPVSLREQVASEIAAVLRRSGRGVGQPSDPLYDSLDILMRCDSVVPHLFVGPAPVGDDDFQQLTAMNVTAILSVQTEEDGPEGAIGRERGAAVERGISFTNLPVTDFDRLELMRKLPKCVAAVEQILEAGETLYLHCTAGINRSPTVAAAYLYGCLHWPLERALEHVRGSRGCCPDADVIRRASGTSPGKDAST